MSPKVMLIGPPRPRQGRSSNLASAMLLAIIALVSWACGSAESASFDPTGPCLTDGRAARAYLDLEDVVPKAIAGRPPASLDSGRNCTALNLGTLAGHGVAEVRFAGGVWVDAAQSGITLAVFRAPGLQAAWMGEWYESSARAARRTGSIAVSQPVVNGRAGNRLDLQNGDSVQTVITWPAAPGSPSALGNVVNVVIAADEPESRIQEAIAAFP